MEIPVSLNKQPAYKEKTTNLNREFCIGRGELYNISVHTIPLRIQCLEGLLWITRGNDPVDYFLQRCQNANFEAGGHIVIQGLSQGRFRILTE